MIKALCFSLYGTLIDIRTDEHDPYVYAVLSNYLAYHSVRIPPEKLKEEYFGRIEEHFEQSEEEYPEVDIHTVFDTIMHRYGSGKSYNESVVADTATLFRSLTVKHFELFPSLADTLNRLQENFRMAIISDAQWIFAEPEMDILDLTRFFEFSIFSSRFGFKKNDARLFNNALEKLAVKPEEIIYIGNIKQKDLHCAKEAGMKCILFRTECPEYGGHIADGCFFDYSVLENIINAIT
jgi:putative hydrolase of the HAD superfamily